MAEQGQEHDAGQESGKERGDGRPVLPAESLEGWKTVM